eukprot:m.3988 g.3988  ORF g.3988 m.3988 type:complete len:109 (+) comp2780_c0_seq1:262-588(+)
MAAHRVSTHRVRPGLVFSPFTPARHAHVVEWVDEVAALVLDTAIHATVCNVWSVECVLWSACGEQLGFRLECVTYSDVATHSNLPSLVWSVWLRSARLHPVAHRHVIS